jgi:excisionase family DNA binding protein
MTVADFCQTIGISRSTWHKLKRTGRTPAIITAGGIQRIRHAAVEDWIAENEERAAADTAHKVSEGPLPLTV